VFHTSLQQVNLLCVFRAPEGVRGGRKIYTGSRRTFLHPAILLFLDQYVFPSVYQFVCRFLLPWGQPLPFIGQDKGQPAVASLGSNCKVRVKLAFYLGWVHAYSRGLGLSGYCISIAGATMVPSAIIPAMLTLGFRSLGLGVVRRVVPCRRSAHSGLVR
jgi:hypothetical protein